MADYQQYFNRVSLVLNGNPKVDLPTDERLLRYTKGESDTGLEALYFQFGRYLLISSSSRPGGIPANSTRHLESSRPPTMEQQLHDKHQYGNELLDGGIL